MESNILVVISISVRYDGGFVVWFVSVGRGQLIYVFGVIVLVMAYRELVADFVSQGVLCSEYEVVGRKVGYGFVFIESINVFIGYVINICVVIGKNMINVVVVKFNCFIQIFGDLFQKYQAFISVLEGVCVWVKVDQLVIIRYEFYID